MCSASNIKSTALGTFSADAGTANAKALQISANTKRIFIFTSFLTSCLEAGLWTYTFKGLNPADDGNYGVFTTVVHIEQVNGRVYCQILSYGGKHGYLRQFDTQALQAVS